jgi:hypothetical protein
MVSTLSLLLFDLVRQQRRRQGAQATGDVQTVLVVF